MVHGIARGRAARDRAVELLDAVSIPEPQRRVRDYPHQLSGGLRQRALIALALACSPSLVIADEPTTALDVTIQAQILDLLRDLQKRLGLALLLITHDLGVVAEMADRVAVMYAGRIVEEAPVRELFRDPRHPYTRGLLGSIPGGARGSKLKAIHGTVPPIGHLPPGCAFAPRCPHRFEPCDIAPPGVTVIDAEARCPRCGRSDATPERTSGIRIKRTITRRAATCTRPRSIRRSLPEVRALMPLLEVSHLVEAVLAQERALRQDRRGPRGGRRELLDREGGDVRAGRGIGQRQDHDGTVHPAADRADRRRGALRRTRRPETVARRSAPGAARHADRFPGPLLLAQSAHARGGHRRGAARHPQAGLESGAPRARHGAVRARRARTPITWRAIRTSSAAASGSASASRGRSR